MKIAIIGAGYAGLSAAYFFRQKGCQIEIFDPDYRMSASYVSTGLMHPYVAKFPLRSKFATEALEASFELFEKIAPYSDEPFYWRKDIFKPLLTPAQEKCFRKLIRKYEDVSYHEMNNLKGIMIHSGAVVNSSQYIEALLKALKIKIIQKKVKPEELKGYDLIVIAAGALTSLTPIKGQMLLLKRPSHLPPLDYAFSGGAHLTPVKEDLYLAGSTYERDFQHVLPDEKADSILKNIEKFYPEIKNYKILERKAGIRYSQDDSYLPVVKRFAGNIWVLSGFGSRGLLYHALYSKLLTDSVLSDV